MTRTEMTIRVTVVSVGSAIGWFGLYWGVAAIWPDLQLTVDPLSAWIGNVSAVITYRKDIFK